MLIPCVQGGASGAAVAPAWTPASNFDAGDLVAWYALWDAATITDAGSGHISALSDKGASGLNLAQSTDASRPITGTRTIGGLNGADCTPNQFLGVSHSFATRPVTKYLVAVTDASAGTKAAGGTHTTSIGFGQSGASAFPTLFDNGTQFVSSVAVSTGTPFQCVYDSTAGAKRVILNGTVTAGPTNDSSLTGNQGIWIGAFGSGSSGWDGIIGEVVIQLGTPSANDLSNWNAYTHTKWGI